MIEQISIQGIVHELAFGIIGAGTSVKMIRRISNEFNLQIEERIIKPAASTIDSRLEFRQILSLDSNKEIPSEIYQGVSQIKTTTFKINYELVIIDDQQVYIYIPINNNSIRYFNLDFDSEISKLIIQKFNSFWNTNDPFELDFEFIYEVNNDFNISLIKANWNMIFKQINYNPDIIHELSSRKFEELVAELLIREGYLITLTGETRDGGRDIIAKGSNALGDYLYLVECKRYSKSNKVGVEVIRNLYGVVEHERATNGLIVTSSEFTKDALNFREKIKYRISTKDYNDLNNWIKQYS